MVSNKALVWGVAMVNLSWTTAKPHGFRQHSTGKVKKNVLTDTNTQSMDGKRK